MKRVYKYVLLSIVVMFLSVSLASAASVFLVSEGGILEDKNAELEITNELTYTFDVYFYASDLEAGSGIYNIGIDVNYNPAIFELAGAPVIDSSVWSIPPSKIIYPDDDEGDYVAGNDFGFYVSDEDIRGLSGMLRIGDFTLTALADAKMGELLITLGDYGPGDDTINLDFEVFDDSMTYRSANAVPIPGTVLLFGSGLLGLMGIGRRRMKKS